MKFATLVILLDKEKDQICLGMKKRGFGAGKWNGFGGKPKDNETIKDAAIREAREETTDENGKGGVNIKKKDLQKVAILDFVFPHNMDWNQQVHIFFVEKWEGDIMESEEMLPKWFDIKDIPYDDMWPDDIEWLPRVLEGETLTGKFSFDEEGKLIKPHHLEKNTLS